MVFSSPVSFCCCLASPAPCERERWALLCGRVGSGGSWEGMMEGMGVYEARAAPHLGVSAPSQGSGHGRCFGKT